MINKPKKGLVQTPYFSRAEPNWISSTLEQHLIQTAQPGVEPKLSSTKFRQTLSNLTLLLHQTKTVNNKSSILVWAGRPLDADTASNVLQK